MTRTINTDAVTEASLGSVLSGGGCMPLLADQASAGLQVEAWLERDAWSGQRLPPTCQSSDSQVDAAVAAAQRSFADGAWRGQPKLLRREVLLRWASLIEADAARLAHLNCLETGRSLSSLLQDSLPKSVQVLRWFAELLDKLDDRAVHTGEFGADFALVRREPIGVVAAILPWNDPLVTLAWKVAPALAMGNAVIVKPSEHATLVVREALQLAHQAGVPIGCLQMLTGDGLAGSRLVQRRDVRKVAFTGSTRTAAAIGAAAHRDGLKRLSFECGGKGAFIFGRHGREPAEFAGVVARNMFYNQGQICSAPSVVHVPHEAADEVAALIGEALKNFLPDHPLQTPGVGFMVSREAVAKARAGLHELDDAVFACAVNDRHAPPRFADWSMTPTVLRGLPDSHPFWDTELFAPILLIRPYRDVAEAVDFANASKFGLAAGVWSQDIDECNELASKLVFGNVHINSWGDDPNQVPFGGVKDSGSGREKAADAFDDYSQTKSIFFRPRGAR